MEQHLSESFLRLYGIVKELRVKCPWDREQTKESIRHLTIEETYELSDAILDNDYPEMKAELGDLFMHMIFYTSMAEDEGKFTTAEMINGICDKLIRRHPHIYGDVQAETSEKVKENWEQIKLKEKKDKGVLEGVPGGLPSLIKALRIQEKVRNVGFDWEKPEDAWDKVIEEQGELQEAIQSGDPSHVEEEFGDLLFSLVNYSRFVGVNAEDALEKTNRKFKKRFEYIEAEARKKGLNLKEMTLAEMDVLWNEAKKLP
jgi:XTP/dITP diphosphohydrolase